MDRKNYNKEEKKELEKEQEFIFSIYEMSKNKLRREVILQRAKVRELQEELDTLKFLMSEVKEDIIYIPEYRVMKNKQKLNK
tara:strand:- start:5533 stop:5778 length:246 start_codon:yes stop_codon:yes gene_type:complete